MILWIFVLWECYHIRLLIVFRVMLGLINHVINCPKPFRWGIWKHGVIWSLWIMRRYVMINDVIKWQKLSKWHTSCWMILKCFFQLHQIFRFQYALKRKAKQHPWFHQSNHRKWPLGLHQEVRHLHLRHPLRVQCQVETLNTYY